MGAKARGITGLAVGTMAPTFVLDDQDGTPVSLAEQRGRWVVLYFYPADDTPACTTQACDLRDSWEALRAAGAVVLGVSPDDAATHRAFRARYRLPFPCWWMKDTASQNGTAHGARSSCTVGHTLA